MISEVISTFTFLTFPKPFLGGKEPKLLLTGLLGKKGEGKF